MEPVRIMMMYGGQWKRRTSRESFFYTGQECKPFIVPRNMRLDDFIQMICRKMDWDLSVMRISLSVVYNSWGSNLPPTSIECDEEFQFFLTENASHPGRYTPIAVTMTASNNNGSTPESSRRNRSSSKSVFRSGSGSNQVSCTAPAINEEAMRDEGCFLSGREQHQESTFRMEGGGIDICGGDNVIGLTNEPQIYHLDSIPEFLNSVVGREENPCIRGVAPEQDPHNEDSDEPHEQECFEGPTYDGEAVDIACYDRLDPDVIRAVQFGGRDDENGPSPPIQRIHVHTETETETMTHDNRCTGPSTSHADCPPIGTEANDIPFTFPSDDHLVTSPIATEFPTATEALANETEAPIERISATATESGPFTSSFRWIPPIPPSSSSTLDTASKKFTIDMLREKDVYIGKHFNSKIELKDKLSNMALRRKFEFRVKRSTKERFEAICAVDSCKWRVRATKVIESDQFSIRTFNNVHTCSGADIHSQHKQASAVVIGKHIMDKFLTDGRVYPPREIISDVQKDLGIAISYNKAWRAKETALEHLHGTPEDSFAILPQYCYMVESRNPGTVTVLDTDRDNHFMNFFLSFGASIAGFSSCVRPVIAVDGSFLKGKFRGTMFLASCLEGNNQIYPLAFGVGHSENDASWTWFMSQLRDHCCQGKSDLAFISDQHGSIERAVANVFPSAVHGLCTYHLKGNLKSKFRNKELLGMFEEAAYQYSESDFDIAFQKIACSNPAAASHLISVGVHKWARAHFPGRRYNIMTTNIAESMNSALRHARFLPISVLAEYYRATLQKWFHDRRTELSGRTKVLTPWCESILTERNKESAGMEVLPISFTLFEVRHNNRTCVVDMRARSCTCRVFDLDEMPCAHAFAVGQKMNLRNLDDYCSPMYRTETVLHAYAEPIMPVGLRHEWDVPEEVKNKVVKPPYMRRPAGRPRKQRIPSTGETVRPRKCSRCGGSGHNRQTCRNPVPL